MTTKLVISLLVQPEKKPKVSLEDKVRVWIKDIEDGISDGHQWNMLRRVFQGLKKMKKRSEEAERLFRLVEPVVEKFASHDVRGVDLNAEDLSIVRGESLQEGPYDEEEGI